jgi:hypothetical protein
VGVEKTRGVQPGQGILTFWDTFLLAIAFDIRTRPARLDLEIPLANAHEEAVRRQPRAAPGVAILQPTKQAYEGLEEAPLP